MKQTQVCSACKEEKEFISKNFAPRHSCKSGLDTKCRVCINADRKIVRDAKKNGTYKPKKSGRTHKTFIPGGSLKQLKYEFIYTCFVGDKEFEGSVMASKQSAAVRVIKIKHPGCSCIDVKNKHSISKSVWML